MVVVPIIRQIYDFNQMWSLDPQKQHHSEFLTNANSPPAHFTSQTCGIRNLVVDPEICILANPPDFDASYSLKTNGP